jgi:hypothetical protein
MEQQQEQRQDLDLRRPLTTITEQQDDTFDHDDAPIVNGMDTLTPGLQGPSRRIHTDPQRKLQAQNRLFQKLQAQLLTAKDALDDSANNNA